MRFVRSVAAILAGLLLITVIAEGIEFGLVTFLRGGDTNPDFAEYFGVRNRPWVLGLKVVYNNLAALAGGFLCAWIAGRRALAHGVALAVAQVAGLVYGMTVSAYASWTPMWMWWALILLMAPAIVLGAWLRGRKRATAAPV